MRLIQYLNYEIYTVWTSFGSFLLSVLYFVKAVVD
jgi:hypothetical protein